MIRTLALILCLALAACGTTSGKPGGPGPDLPRPPETPGLILPPEACASILAEPLPPEGVSITAVVQGLASTLGPEKAAAVWRWISVESRTWGQEGWDRLSALRPLCARPSVATDDGGQGRRPTPDP